MNDRGKRKCSVVMHNVPTATIKMECSQYRGFPELLMAHYLSYQQPHPFSLLVQLQDITFVLVDLIFALYGFTE